MSTTLNKVSDKMGGAWKNFQALKLWKKALIGLCVAGSIIAIVTLSVEFSKPKHKKSPHGGSMQSTIMNAYNRMTRQDENSAPMPVGDALPQHRYVRQGMDSPNTYHYRMGSGFRPHVQADGVRGPQGKMMQWHHSTGANSEYDISQKRHGLGANSEIDISQRRNGLGANSEIDISKRRNGLGANSDYNLSRLPMGSADAGPTGTRLEDAYSTDYTAPADPQDGSNTYVDYSPDDTSVGGPAFASDNEASAQLLTDVYGDAYKPSGDQADNEVNFIGTAMPSTV